MTESSNPWQGTTPGDAGPYTSLQWDDNFQRFYTTRDGIVRNWRNELTVTVTAPVSAAVRVDTGGANIRGKFYDNDAALTLDIDANASGNPRVDTVVLRVNWTTQTVRAAILAGTPAAAPTPAALTQTDGTLWEFALAYVTVANGFVTIAAANIINCYDWLAMPSNDEYESVINLVKNYPSLEVADGVQPEWWEESGGGTLTEEDATGEGIVQKYERVIQFDVVTGDSDYMYQTWTHADEPQLDDSTTVVSLGVWVYTADAGRITVTLYDDGGAGELDKTGTWTTGSWVFLSLENITIGSTSTTLRITHSEDSSTIYVAMPMLNVGRRVMPWQMRRLRHVEIENTILTAAPPATGAWTDVDTTAFTSNQTVMLELMVRYRASAVGVSGFVRRNGNTVAIGEHSRVFYTAVANVVDMNASVVRLCDDGQIIEYYAEANTNLLYMAIEGCWEWE